MRLLICQMPVETLVEIPFPSLAEFLAHEQQLLARMPPHVSVIGPQVGELLPGIAGHAVEDRALAGLGLPGDSLSKMTISLWAMRFDHPWCRLDAAAYHMFQGEPWNHPLLEERWKWSF